MYTKSVFWINIRYMHKKLTLLINPYFGNKLPANVEEFSYLCFCF